MSAEYFVSLTIPLKTVSEPNRRDHHHAKARRVASQRDVVSWELLAVRNTVAHVPLPVDVLLVRLAPGELDDDNLAGALKAVRDEVAKAWRVDDADPRIRFRYGQEASRVYQVRVEVQTRPPEAAAQPERS